MAQNQKKYDTEYKVQAVKLSKEIGPLTRRKENHMFLHLRSGFDFS